MLIAEALNRRAEIHQVTALLLQRMNNAAMVQEGDTPVESADSLLDDIVQLNTELHGLVFIVNVTNARTIDPVSNLSITGLIAQRDALRMKRKYVLQLAQSATAKQNRYGREEIKMVRTVDDPLSYFSEADNIAAQLRDLETRIQRLNWSTELYEGEMSRGLS